MTTSPRPGSEVALIDANVLFSHHTRNVLVTLAVEGAFKMRWSGSIEKEWTSALLRERPHLRRQAVMATALKMKQALPDASVIDFEALESAFPKTDAKDRPVAAAAARCAPCSLVTWNKRDFNEDELAAHAIGLIDPDTLLCRLFDADAAFIVAATQRAFGFLRRPEGHPTWAEYIDLLGTNNRLKQFAQRVRTFAFEDRSTGLSREGDLGA